MIEIEIADQQSHVLVDANRIMRGARAILEDHGPSETLVSIAIVDDPTIHVLNRQYLRHDYPTDVLSFVLEQRHDMLEGEVVVSADTAARQAERFGWAADDELLLYIIHGVLHLVGFDDQSDEARVKMRGAERSYLARVGVTVRDQVADTGSHGDE
jgi:probable rRNA maturation factor